MKITRAKMVNGRMYGRESHEVTNDQAEAVIKRWRDEGTRWESIYCEDPAFLTEERFPV